MAEFKIPTETVTLPSKGAFYSENNPFSKGTVEIKYMTAKEEDILTSQNLIKKGLVIEKLLDSLILTKGVKSEDLIIGDKNATEMAVIVIALDQRAVPAISFSAMTCVKNVLYIKVMINVV